ncbi:hypothetical protein [Paraburkholderia fynbosensis]|uniref:Uncharacterized protein n=1 Tax=Paraburkholderia fynbosensis TaxID=1200993 RepID=A0A6J5FAG5_9BURK|nr:hypothetical protein [Paraburkholderia fynbosensis]CAB3776184.1 hypothetical protein LMG27177_00090 [Paraburkholderia fynbosensis]
MAAASTDPALRARDTASALAVCAAGSACVLIAGGGAALSMRAGLGPLPSALWMSGLALATMMGTPLLMARSTRRATVATAATLIVTMSAMNALPAVLSGLQHGGALAALMIAAGGALLFYWRQLGGTLANERHHANDPAQTTRAASTTVLLALLAGMSSGTLARFQLFAVCGAGAANGVQPLWHIALSLAAVCALACYADRSRNDRMLSTLYVARALLIGTLATVDNPALAPLAAKLFLLLDCLTIPALANLRGNTRRALSASCPGIAHHIGMLAGAALSTTPYFFGNGFVVLFGISAAANLICAASLAAHWRGMKTFHLHAHRYHNEAHSSG